MKMLFRAGAGAAAAMMLVAAAPAVWADADPAATQIDTFDNALVGVMKQGASLGAQGRARKLAPAMAQAFNFAAMTRFAVGPAWATMSDADHAALTAAFARFSAASFAHNFDNYGGERFTVDPNVETRGIDKIVKSQIIPAHGAPIVIDYRMRSDGGTWKIIDVYFNGTISQLTTRRSDFAATASQGAKALIAHMDEQTDKLLK